ncbi:MAG: PilT/PilU family type 4a pilus ATPase [Chlamydiota bacterium]
MVDLSGVLREAVTRRASDIHLKAGCPPILRIATQLVSLDHPPLAPSEIEAVAQSLVGKIQWASFLSGAELDVAYLDPAAGRFRTNIFHQRGMVGIVMRHVQTSVPGFKDLGLPPIIKKIALTERGIVIVSGATGSGKSTTLAAMIDFINARLRRHIVTIEDPIEFIHDDVKSLIEQREVGIDTRSFPSALRCVMRQDPDIIMVGEMRDKESFMAVLAAADVGRLSLATLHSPDAAQVVLRVMDFFPVAEREQARLQLAANVVAIICQRLIPRADGKGAIPAVEIMLGTTTVRKLIRENKVGKLTAAIQDGKDLGMQTFNQALVELVQASLITEDAALSHSPSPESLKMNLQGIYLDESRQILGDD